MKHQYISKQSKINPSINKEEIEKIVSEISNSMKINTVTDFNKQFRIAGKTAITRRGVSGPLKHAYKIIPEIFKGKIIHFGKGKANHDDIFLSGLGDLKSFDFVHCNYPMVLLDDYRLLVANYVLNVLPDKERHLTLGQISSLVNKEKGCALISVRSNKESAIKKLYKTGTREGVGVRTSTGTFQIGYSEELLISEVSMYFKYTRTIKSPSGFRIVIASHNPI